MSDASVGEPDAARAPDASEQDAEADAQAPPDAGDEDAAQSDAGDVLLAPPAGNEHRPTGIAHCYTELSSDHAAMHEFWRVFLRGELGERAMAIEALTAAADEYPQEQELALSLGLAHLWRLAEPLSEEVDDMAGRIRAALGARSELERAYELCPTDHRIPAWLGPILVNTGRAVGDDGIVEDGLAVLQQGIDHYPSFVLFSKLLVYADLPKTDPDFQNAVEALRDNVMVCGAQDPACSNHPRAAHNREGASIFMGDVLAKSGDLEAARETYEGIRQEPTYGSWAYQALLDARLETLSERVAAFDTEDPADDHESAWNATYQCSICHRQ